MKKQDIDDLRELIEFLKQHQVAEFDVDRGDLKIRLKFNPPESGTASLSDLARLLRTAPQSVAQAAAAATEAASGSGSAGAAADSAADPDAGLHLVKSPIVGTFYGSPSPGAAPFVAPGDHVEKGQVIGIIEAMKLMNEIEADVSGEVVKCLVSNGQAIEFGQPLYSIRSA
ncbi:MAG: acetyl-CoA carboxylase biotin carboxyl carrier protein [Candidatus Sulfopaludibacter sp.]|nr:acetyl-CoA carboxylase biotin carboxyl carrier protein [Candidatus Sulfopaludibacter sp.]